jgi:antitoxin ParD1/3/4
MNVAIQPEQEQFIQSQIAKGTFKSVDEAAFEAFKLLEEKYQEYEDWIEDTRAKVAVAVAELDRGEGVELETVLEQLQHKFQVAKETI